MLDKNDVKTIKDIVIDSLGEFYATILGPYLDKKFKQNDEEHARIREGLDVHENSLDTLIRKADKNEDDHDEIFRRLDKNDKEHEKTHQKLEMIDEKLSEHSKRIKKVETTLVS